MKYKNRLNYSLDQITLTQLSSGNIVGHKVI